MEIQAIIEYTLFIDFLELIYKKDLYTNLLTPDAIQIYCRMLNFNSNTYHFFKCLIISKDKYLYTYNILIKLLHPSYHIDTIRGALYYITYFQWNPIEENRIILEQSKFITDNNILLQYEKINLIDSVLIKYDIIKNISLLINQKVLNYEWYTIFEILQSQIQLILKCENGTITEIDKKTIALNDIKFAKTTLRSDLEGLLLDISSRKLTVPIQRKFHSMLLMCDDYSSDDIKKIIIRRQVYIIIIIILSLLSFSFFLFFLSFLSLSSSLSLFLHLFLPLFLIHLSIFLLV